MNARTINLRMKRRLRFTWVATLLFGCLVNACVPGNIPGFETLNPIYDIASASAAQTAITNFLDAWQAEDYQAMYVLLSSLSQDAISFDDFESAYRNTAQELTLESLAYKILSAMASENRAEVAYRVDFNTKLFGTIRRDLIVNLVREQNTWLIQWERGVIFPEFKSGLYLQFVGERPSRGRIFDKNGAPLASYEDAIAVGVVPGMVLPEQAEQVYQALAQISIYDSVTLRAMVEATPDDWYLPIVTLSQAEIEPYLVELRALSGLRLDGLRERFYVDGGVAPHVLGYLGYITEEELDTYLRLGYQQDERVGRAGLEAAFETELSGKRGGSLYLVNEEGVIQTLISASEAVPGNSLYTTLDKGLQMRLQASLGNQRAAVVVMEVNTGRVLALVSNPHFDPNVFDLRDPDRDLLTSYLNNEDQPLFNRATQGQYPLGSVFKTITMSAALEEGVFSARSSFYCGQSLWVCDSVYLYDWTYSHGVAPSGTITLTEGLVRSCNPWFYRIGESLFNEGHEDSLSLMATGFGLGEATGIEISEAVGNIPEIARTCVESAQLSIGQGEILVTPLQVAAYFAALANGGTLYQPALIDAIKTSSGLVVQSFSPQENGKLPVSERNLAAVQEGLRLVLEDPAGTGYRAVLGLDVPVSGKTGTAQTPSGDPHAWFAGYSWLNDPERPDIAVAVIVENAGEGSAIAAPLFRRAVSLYFSNNEDPGGLMPWEVEPYIMPEQTPDSDLSPTGE